MIIIQIHCPNCYQVIERSQDSDDTQAPCSSCGASMMDLSAITYSLATEKIRDVDAAPETALPDRKR